METNFNYEGIACKGIYHVFYKGKQNEILFPTEEHYSHFLRLFFENISPLADVYSYCLLPNQFHIVLKIKSEKVVFTYFKIAGRFPEETMTLQELKELSEKSEFNKINILSIHLQKQFSHFFNIYAKELFLQKHRKDKLLGAFNSKKLTDESEIRSTVTQIHMLALQEKLVSELTSWKYNSYNAMLSDKPTRLMRKEVIDIFESVDYFKRDHQEELKKSFLTN
jgi:hypothetical protein